MSEYNNKKQVVIAAAYWVFGGDGTMDVDEVTKVMEAIKEYWPNNIKDDYEDWKWICDLFASGQIHLVDIVDAVENEFDFSTEEKYQLYQVIVGSMYALGQGSNKNDGWNRAYMLEEAIGIDRDSYNNWQNSVQNQDLLSGANWL